MFRGSQVAMAAAILLVGSEAMAWSTSTIPGTSAAGHTAQGYAWKDWGGGSWSKWHSVAYGTRTGDAVRVARRDANNAFPAWLPWVVETVDDSLWRLHGLSLAIGKQDGTEFVAYVDASPSTARRRSSPMASPRSGCR
ncbi:hypothetical protein [Sorangium cellulosum]|uniref:hypothetical protein n=1 Tax=Sorangium cellulosum TaxID=56 RepID=UPI000CF54E03|nr:hypothetical protein [Sorangium cellulosum]